MTNYQSREANYKAGYDSANIRRTLLGIKKGTQKYTDIMAGHAAAKRMRIASANAAEDFAADCESLVEYM